MSSVGKKPSLDEIFHPAPPPPARPAAPPPKVHTPSAVLAERFKQGYRVANARAGGSIPEVTADVRASVIANAQDGSVKIFTIRNPDGSPGSTKVYASQKELPNPSVFFIEAPRHRYYGGPYMVGPLKVGPAA